MSVDRHAWRLVPSAERAGPCGQLRCPERAAYEAIYQFQRAGDVAPTRRVWHYCLRHAAGWARTHNLEVPEAPRSASVDPDGGEGDMAPSHASRRSIGRGRLWGGRASVGRRRV